MDVKGGNSGMMKGDVPTHFSPSLCLFVSDSVVHVGFDARCHLYNEMFDFSPASLSSSSSSSLSLTAVCHSLLQLTPSLIFFISFCNAFNLDSCSKGKLLIPRRRLEDSESFI